MAGASSILRSAAARRSQIQQQKNRLVDAEWELSAKSAADYEAYKSYYEGLLGSSTPSDVITYQNKLTSARRSYVSNELQRSTIAVLEGTATKEDKLNAMVSFYQTAVDNGDYDQAQNLNQQIDTLYNQILTDQQNQLNLATTAYNNGYQTAKDYVADLKKGDASPFPDGQYGLNQLNDLFRMNGRDGMGAVMEEVSNRYGVPVASYSDLVAFVAGNTINAIQTYRDSFPPNSPEYMKLNNELVDAMQKPIFELPGKDGNIKVTYEEILQSAESERLNGTGAFTAVMGPNGSYFERNKVQQWEVTVGPDGTAQLIPRYVSPSTEQAQSNLGAGGTDYRIVTADLGLGDGPKTYYQDIKGDLYSKAPDMNGKFMRQNLVMDAQTLQKRQVQAEQQYLSAPEALKQLGFKVEGDKIYYTTPDGTEQPYQYQVDENGNVQFSGLTTDPNTGEKLQEIYTIDTKTGAVSTASEDARKFITESKRISSLLENNNVSNPVQSQVATTERLQAAGASQVLQNAQTLKQNVLQKASQVQQAASAQKISQLPAQPISVQPIPQAPKLTVQPIPTAPKLTVQPVPAAPNLSVYTPPKTAGTVPKVTVDNTPRNYNLRVQ